MYKYWFKFRRNYFLMNFKNAHWINIIIKWTYRPIFFMLEPLRTKINILLVTKTQTPTHYNSFHIISPPYMNRNKTNFQVAPSIFLNDHQALERAPYMEKNKQFLPETSPLHLSNTIKNNIFGPMGTIFDLIPWYM